MRDPYLYEDVPVLKNKLNIKDSNMLDKAESDITYIKLLDIEDVLVAGDFSYPHLKNIHKHIFGDIYEWAGEERIIPIVKGEEVWGGDTVHYANPDDIEEQITDALADLKNVSWFELSIKEFGLQLAQKVARVWQVHPFREGNTRTTIVFAVGYVHSLGLHMDKELLDQNPTYVRNALVVASDGEYSEYQYLAKIFMDAMGYEQEEQQEQENDDEMER